MEQPPGYFPDLRYLGEVLLVLTRDPAPFGLPHLHGGVRHVVPAVAVVVGEQPSHGVLHVGVRLAVRAPGQLCFAPGPRGFPLQAMQRHPEHLRERR